MTPASPAAPPAATPATVAERPGHERALLALVDAHFIGNGPYPLQLVCLTEDAHDVECDQTIAEVEPGATWDELEALIAAHAAECHVPAQEPPRAVTDLTLPEAPAPPPAGRRPQEATPARAFVDARCWHGETCRSKGAYRMTGTCLNCRSQLLGLHTVGHEATSGILGTDCPVCGCTTLQWHRLATSEEIPVDFEERTND